VRTVPGNGLIVANGAEPALARVLARGCWTPVERFGGGGWQAGDRLMARCLRGVPWENASRGRVMWDLLGAHNRMNALAAIAAARHAGVPAGVAVEALGQFERQASRMEVRGTVRGVTVYDDFAHHPTAIATTVAGLRRKAGAARILAVLEPRSNTMKLGSQAVRGPQGTPGAPAGVLFVGRNRHEARLPG
jgi:UDP-N-acetylmuramate: L-alanyl-gamma-D-glutamyl-meso-diaminopimelate ligase